MKDYDHFSKSCVKGQAFVKYADQSISECMALCSAWSDCLLFEYGVPHGGGGTLYEPRDCLLKRGGDKSGCDGSYNNLDLYVKIGNILSVMSIKIRLGILLFSKP